MVGLLLALTLAAVAYVQTRQHQLLDSALSTQGDMLQASLPQLEVEYLRLLGQWRLASEAAGRGQPVALEALRRRYDVFVSRVSTLDTRRIDLLVGHRSELDEARRAVHGFVAQADRYLTDPPLAQLDAAALDALQARLELLAPPIHGLAIEATHSTSKLLTERTLAVRQHNRVGIALTVLLSLATLAFALMTMRQMRQLEGSRKGLADLADHLRLAQRDAEAASQAKSAFLANMSHELRTPFQGVLGMLSLLRDSGLNARQLEQVRTATESADHLLVILNDILDISRLESGTLKLAPEPVDLRRLLGDVEALMRPQAAVKGLGWSVHVDADLPGRVLADPTRVRQVLFNLTSNAVKFSDAGSVALQVRRAAGDIVFEVRDTGIGMDESTRARLFQRFSQGDSSPSRRHGGTGLGLEISRSLAWLMGGDIEVDSTPGGGSTFEFRVPLVETPPLPVEAAAARAGDPAAPRRLKVLVAEDHPVNRKYLSALLDSMGHEAQFAGHGQEALDAVRTRDFDAVLMDVHMPVLDGLAATRAIRALPGPRSQLRIIALTADAFSETRERCLQAGMNEVLVKPIDAQQLAAVLDDMAATLPHRAAAPVRAESSEPAPARAESCAPAPEPALIDRDRLDQVRTVLPGERFGLLSAGFLRDGRDAASRMHDALGRGDAHALREAAHRTKGAALSIGLTALAGAAEDLQLAAGHADAPTLHAFLGRYERLLDESARELRRLGLVRAAAG